MRSINQYVFLSIVSALVMNCSEGNKSRTFITNVDTNDSANHNSNLGNNEILVENYKRQKIKLGHSVNTSADEYLPVINSKGSRLYFSAMDRTGFFDFKLDYTKQKSAGGEDIFYSSFNHGVLADARPIAVINTNGHEVVSQVMENEDLLVTANYPEKFGSTNNSDAKSQTTDLFLLRKTSSNYQIFHFPEPVNSIFTEADGWMAIDESYIMFVSDRPGHVGNYHKKGWKWNDSFWGNTDVYVSLKDGDLWSVPVNLGPVVNSEGAERTPWLSNDGLTLYVSSNGYQKGKKDLDVFAFRRKDKNNWTGWTGPFKIVDANSQFDDWGYKESTDGDAYIASASPLGFKPTQGGKAGDGGIFETNFRPGYELVGLQTASLNMEFETNIYLLKHISKPSFVIDDVFFEFNSYLISKSFEKYLELIIDQIKLNNSLVIVIDGHTDNQGDKYYNKELSLKRAEAIKKTLLANGVNNLIRINGFGDEKPVAPNTSKENKQRNRRVEIYLKENDGR